ncbi:MAG: hypothetical protein IMF02_08730, partial [Proteobacteria bacterium]|nr:hypothetical protein [Pseudomonadota bacterium]
MKPDTCHCCKPPTGGTPVTINNRPGLSAIAYRVGDFANFRQVMFQAISRSPELHHLSTRLSDDYAITIFELWAAIGDILTFYQERIAGEAFLRTAGLRDSVLRMARMIGYELAPGSAATAFLNFTADKGKHVQVPVGLRVQSVPGQDEKPQKYESLETITVYDWLNEQAIFPAPVGINPLAKGSMSAYLSTGKVGLKIAENLVENDCLLLFDPIKTELEPVEKLVVKKVEIEHEHMKVRWSGPVHGTQWDMTSRCYKLVRSVRLFGYNVPLEYPHPNKNESTGIIDTWTIKENNFEIDGDGGRQLHLDSRYNDIKVGTPLLLMEGTKQQSFLTVTAVDQYDKTLGLVSDTVTRITVTPQFSKIDDCRQVVIYELTGPPISFWGFSYPDSIDSAIVYIPGHRIDTENVEIARPIKKNTYQKGFTVNLTDIETDRQTILNDEKIDPITAKINRAELTGNEIVFDAITDDTETVSLLSLDRGSASNVTGLYSARIEEDFEFINARSFLKVTIGKVGPRPIYFIKRVTFNLQQEAAWLQGMIRMADSDPLFRQSIVGTVDNHFIVLPGVRGETISFEKTSNDETVIVGLGLGDDQIKIISGFLSGRLDSVLAYTNLSPKISVRIGPVGPLTIKLDSTKTILTDVADDLQSKLNSVSIAPFFKYARVEVFDQRLAVFPGMIGTLPQDYLKIELSTNNAIALDRSSALLLGNVASASHGETVANEILGDADPAIPFQKFTVKKNPVTFVPSSAEGGVDNTLQLFINDVLWKEVDSLFDTSKKDTVYTTRINNDAEMSVRFGNGVTGARPPKGRANVMARYRQGLGLDGRVKAGALKTLLDKPKGLKSVLNPAGADGGANPETLDNARKNSPTTVRTFDRAVSLLDLEDLARSRSEVAKAKVTWVWCGDTQVAHLTIAGQGGGYFSASALARIHASLTAQRDPNRRLLMGNSKPIPILVTATLNVEATYVAAK